MDKSLVINILLLLSRFCLLICPADSNKSHSWQSCASTSSVLTFSSSIGGQVKCCHCSVTAKSHPKKTTEGSYRVIKECLFPWMWEEENQNNTTGHWWPHNTGRANQCPLHIYDTHYTAGRVNTLLSISPLWDKGPDAVQTNGLIAFLITTNLGRRAKSWKTVWKHWLSRNNSGAWTR